MLSKSQDCPPNVGGRAQRRGYYPRKYYHLPLFEGKGLRHSSGKLKFPSSLPTLIPRRPPTLGGEFKVLDNIYIIALMIQREFSIGAAVNGCVRNLNCFHAF